MTSQETFAAKFKTAELAESFRDVFSDCVERVKAAPAADTASQSSDEASDDDVSDEATADAAAAPPAASVKPKSLAEQFKPASGSWECSGCYCRNASDVITCPACETVKPGCEAEVAKQKQEQTSSALSACWSANSVLFFLESTMCQKVYIICVMYT